MNALNLLTASKEGGVPLVAIEKLIEVWEMSLLLPCSITTVKMFLMSLWSDLLKVSCFILGKWWSQIEPKKDRATFALGLHPVTDSPFSHCLAHDSRRSLSVLLIFLSNK